jgi:hypothetical protein
MDPAPANTQRTENSDCTIVLYMYCTMYQVLASSILRKKNMNMKIMSQWRSASILHAMDKLRSSDFDDSKILQYDQSHSAS